MPPPLHTVRLVLRPFRQDDAADVERMVSDREVAATTLSIPHPYPLGAAAEWIAKQAETYESGRGVAFAITLKDDHEDGGELVGSIDLRINADHQHAEMGYVIGRKSWGSGYATEAARAVLEHGFGSLGLRRIYAHHMTINPASGAVLRKIGMIEEGTMRQHILKWGEARDIVFYGITRDEYHARRQR